MSFGSFLSGFAGGASTGLGLKDMRERREERSADIAARSAAPRAERSVFTGSHGGVSSAGGNATGRGVSGAEPAGRGGAPYAEFNASLARTESGGRYGVVNSEGYSGKYQFGQDRLDDYNRAAGTSYTTAQLVKDPALQETVQAWHIGDIDRFIDTNGLDKHFGEEIGGVTMTRDGMRAMAHLGGTNGMRKFVTTGGRYNPSDSNGTSLSKYARIHGDIARGGGDVAARRADPRAHPQSAPQNAPPSQPQGGPLGMIGGVKGDGDYWQGFGERGMAHASRPDYKDYSQLFRDYSLTPQEGWVQVGERDGKPLYAAPDYARDEDGTYLSVSSADAQRLAQERGGIIPTQDEVRALYDQAEHIPMPTQPIGETGGPGDPVAYTQAVTASMTGVPPGAPVVHGKEFYAPGAQPRAPKARGVGGTGIAMVNEFYR